MNHPSTAPRSRLYLLLAFWVLAALSYSHGFVLAPMSMDFDPSGRGATRNFRIENDSDAPVAVQITIVRRIADLDGKEKLEDAKSEFTVYPEQAVVQPKQSQRINVRWIGTNKVDRELSYRIVAEQLPVQLDKNLTQGAKINIALRYMGAIYIMPKNAAPDIQLISATPDKDDKGNPVLALVVENRGTSHGFPLNLKVLVTGEPETAGGSREVVLEGPKVKGMEAENVLSGNKRRFLLPWPEGLKPGPVQVKLEFTPSR